MKKIIIDCDNTFGVEGCDVDDGLAIIYSLGCENCEVVGVTTTFGNNDLSVVYPNTINFMKNIGKGNIPVLEGHENNPRQNKAAKFLADSANKYPGEISLLAIGSLTNLYHAYILDEYFFEKIAEISLMGGITKPLIIGGKNLCELNFSCNYEASYNVLTKARELKIATGNNCLDVFFTEEEFSRHKWLYDKTRYWFEREKAVFGHKGIYKWDVHAAAALLNPQFFHERVAKITPDSESLKTGELLGSGEKINIILPVIKNSEEYINHVYEMYEKSRSAENEI